MKLARTAWTFLGTGTRFRSIWWKSPISSCSFWLCALSCFISLSQLTQFVSSYVRGVHVGVSELSVILVCGNAKHLDTGMLESTFKLEPSILGGEGLRRVGARCRFAEMAYKSKLDSSFWRSDWVSWDMDLNGKGDEGLKKVSTIGPDALELQSSLKFSWYEAKSPPRMVRWPSDSCSLIKAFEEKDFACFQKKGREIKNSFFKVLWESAPYVSKLHNH